MKKILAPFDGLRCSERTITRAADFAKRTGSLLVGVFVHDPAYSHLADTSAWNILTHYYLDYEPPAKEDERKMDDAIRLFEKICHDKEVPCKVHRYGGAPLVELSAFADLILINSTGSFTEEQKVPRSFLKDLLVQSKCPVLLIPDSHQEVKHAVVAYDGSDSSVYAMKMFSYLFPEWEKMETTVLTVNHSSSNLPPSNRDVQDLANGHFKNVSFKVINGTPEIELEKYLGESAGNTVVVMGAYGRSAYSRMLHESISKKILSELKVPLFISHQ